MGPGDVKKRKRKRNRRRGRNAKKPLLGNETPGGLFLLALVGAAPIVALFVIGQTLLASRGVHPMEAWPTWRALFYVVTPAASALALWYHRGAPPWVQDHNAGRAARLLAWANLFIWFVFGSLYLLLFVLT